MLVNIEWTLVVDIVQNIAVIGIAAYLVTRLAVFRRTLNYSQYRLRDKIFIGCMFGLFSAMGNWIGIPVHGALANSRIVGPIAGGLLGGPLVGVIAGGIGAIARYFMGGFTVWAAVLSNILVGYLSGLVYERLGPNNITVKVAVLTALLGEIILKVMILTLSVPYEAAWRLEQTIGIPTLIANTIGVVLFVSIVRDVFREEERLQAFSVQQAIRMVRKTSGLLQAGLNETSALALSRIIYQEIRPAAVGITDNEKILAYIGEGSDHHLVGMPILTRATRQVINDKQTAILNGREEIGCPNPSCKLTAGVDAPIIILGEPVGTVKLYKTKHDIVTSQEAELIQGIADSVGYQLAQQRYEQQQLMLVQTEYNMLRAQINPHFFFNTLSNIQSLVRNDRGAVGLIKDLAMFFRKTLKRTEELVPLAEELDTVNVYFRIEKARFRDRVNLDLKIPADMQAFFIPTFSVQPLVENAIKHGISVKQGGGTIHLSAWHDDEYAYIQVSDDGAGMTEEKLAEVLRMRGSNSVTGAGIGLENVHRRVQMLYGQECGLTVTSGLGKGTEATVKLPWRKE